MEIQNLSSIDEQVIKLLKKNPSRSLSAMFRQMQKRLPLVGDIPLLLHLAKLWSKIGIGLNDNQIYTALRYSDDYKNASRGKSKFFIELRNCLPLAK